MRFQTAFRSLEYSQSFSETLAESSVWMVRPHRTLSPNLVGVLGTAWWVVSTERRRVDQGAG